MSGARSRRSGDRGVAAIVFALMLTALLTMSAIAIDLGAAYTERRHDQNTADVAAMSGSVEAVLGGGIIDNVVEEVRLKVDTTLGTAVTAAQWQACTDSDRLHHTARSLAAANPVISPVTDCISFSRTFEEVRVKLPPQTAIGVFGPSLGFGNIRVTASANASIESSTGGLPFVALATATTGDFVCLRTSSAKEPLPLANGNGPAVLATYPVSGAAGARPDPCHSNEFDTESENFGTLQPWRYANCTQQNVGVETAISIGLDHPMGVFPLGFDPTFPKDTDGHVLPEYQERFDGAPFSGGPGCQTAYPNTFKLDTGLNAAGLNCALMGKQADETCNDVQARLRGGGYVQTGGSKLLTVESYDNTPPWHFLRSSSELVGFAPECIALADNRSNPAWDQYDRYETFTACLKKWGQVIPVGDPGHDGTKRYSSDQLFVKEIGASARFGFVPQVAEDSLASISFVHIEGFLPIFMYRMYIQETGPMCDPSDPRNGSGLKVHDAGVPWDCAGSNKTIDRLASIILACGMVDATLCDKSSGAPNYSGKDIYEFRLVK